MAYELPDIFLTGYFVGSWLDRDPVKLALWKQVGIIAAARMRHPAQHTPGGRSRRRQEELTPIQLTR